MKGWELQAIFGGRDLTFQGKRVRVEEKLVGPYL
jgi:hypothetical protein